MKIKSKIFADHDVNTSRQYELDLARAVIIFCLALIHCTIECTSDEGLTSGIPYLFDTIIGGPFSAPMYMFVMGVGLIFTSKKSLKFQFTRGFKIFLGGYLLNICRFLIPYLTGYAITGEYDAFMEPLLYKVLGNDILTFAGLAIMILTLFIKLKLPNLVMLGIAVVMCALGTLLNGVDVGSPLGNIFLGYLIGTEDAAGMVLSDFPILNWLMFPVSGYVFGAILKRVVDKKRFYLAVSLPAFLIAIVYFTYGVYMEVGMFGEGQNCYYHMIFPDVLASLALTIGMIGVYYALSRVLPGPVMKLAGEISVNIKKIYCIHWVLISWIVNVLIYTIRGTAEFAPGMVMLLGTAISIASILIARYYKRWLERRRMNAKAS